MRDELGDDARMKQRFSPPSAIVPAIVHLARCRREFTGNVVRRTDFIGDMFSSLVWQGHISRQQPIAPPP